MSLSENIDKVKSTILDVYNSGNKLNRAKLDHIMSLLENTKSVIIDKFENLYVNKPTVQSLVSTPVAAVAPAAPVVSNDKRIIINVGKNKSSNDVIKNAEKSFAEALRSKNIDAYMGNCHYNKANGNVIVRVDTNESLDSVVTSMMDKNPSYTSVKVSQKMSPKILVSGIPPETAEDKQTLKDKIIAKNDFLNADKEFEVLFTFNNRAGKLNAVCKIAADSRELVKKLNNTLKIDYRLCRVYDHLRLSQCSRCCRFGHQRKNCQSISPACTFCGGEHLYSNCDKKAESTHKCFNCIAAKVDDVNHNAFSKSCPIYKKEFKKLISKVQYSSSVPNFEDFHPKLTE